MTRPVFGWKWLLAPVACITLSSALGVFDTFTEITPNHTTISDSCLALGALGALGLASVALVTPMAWWNRLYLALAMALLGFLSVFLLSYKVAELTENYIDFPAGTTCTFPALLRISRAYQTHGKAGSWSIQTMPVWSNMSITEDDYQLMLAHRRPGDTAGSPDEISSKGYFCAKVIMQRSGNAFRVLHAGNQRLPAGTVVICPALGKD